jgi:hypothetical protein
VPILLCLWSAHPEAEVPERASAETDANLVATGMAGALAQLEELNIGVVAPDITP